MISCTLYCTVHILLGKFATIILDFCYMHKIIKNNVVIKIVKKKNEHNYINVSNKWRHEVYNGHHCPPTLRKIKLYLVQVKTLYQHILYIASG